VTLAGGRATGLFPSPKIVTMRQQKKEPPKTKEATVKRSEKKSTGPKSVKALQKEPGRWAKSGFGRMQEIRIRIPVQALALLRLTGVKPDSLLLGFLDDLSHDSWKRNPDGEVRSLLVEYFLKLGYGQDYYSPEDIRQMFREMDAIGSLWPENGGVMPIMKHAKWRNWYYKYWFKKWYYKVRRKKL
jgi:hypothetical protein